MKSSPMATEEVNMDFCYGGRDFNLTLDVSGRYVDAGIGSYEYWGSMCCDSHYEFELDSIDNIQLHCWNNEERYKELQYDKMSKQIRDALDEAVNKLDFDDLFSDSFGGRE